LTSNRDESPSRHSPGLTTLEDTVLDHIHFPLDPSSGGSWIAVSHSGRIACLLNGAFSTFIPNPPYRISRGQIVMEAARTPDLASYIHDVDLDGVAPFTLVIVDAGKLTELVWDERDKHLRHPDPLKPGIWSSATLYPEDVRKWRSDFFEAWIEDHPSPDREEIIAFHQIKRGDGQNDFIMNRQDMVKTLSVTNVELKDTSTSIWHLDLERGRREETTWTR
jgi:hypothetical protein